MAILESIWDLGPIKASPEVMRECIRTSRILAEMKGMMKVSGVPRMFLGHIALKEAVSCMDLDGMKVDLGDAFRDIITTEVDFAPEVESAVILATLLTAESESAPTVEYLEETCTSVLKQNMVHSETSDKPLKEYFEFVNIYDHPIDELISLCAAHLQFHCIHPFEKGNIIANIVLTHMLLDRYGLSNGCNTLICPRILMNREEYFRELESAANRKDMERWILFMLRMIREGAQDTMSFLFSVEQRFDEISQMCENTSFWSTDLMELLFSNVYCKTSTLVQAGIAERVTAMKYLKNLEGMGLLKSEKIGRELVFRNLPLYNELVR